MNRSQTVNCKFDGDDNVHTKCNQCIYEEETKLEYREEQNVVPIKPILFIMN